MIGLLDTDVLYKLICCELLDDALSYLELEESRILEAAYFIIQKQIFGKEKFGYDQPALQDRVIRVVKSFPQLQDPPPESMEYDLLGSISSIPGINSGEAMLLYQTIKDESMLLVSGDKRFYKGLIGNKPLMEVCSHLEGKLIGLEHLLLCLIERHGFPYICQRVAPVRQCDGTLRLAFPGGEKTDADHAISALVSYSKPEVLGLGSLCYAHRHWYE